MKVMRIGLLALALCCPSCSLLSQGLNGQNLAGDVTSADPQEELERLHNVVSKFTANACQNIGSLVTIVEADSKLSAQQSQSPQVAEILKTGVTLDEYLRAARVLHCLTHDQKQYKIPPFKWVIQNSGVLNAWADYRQRIITLTSGITDFTRDDPGELAFIIAHELGHLVDQPLGCAAALQRENRQSLFPVVMQRECEARADNIGFQYLVGAGFNRYSAPAFVGRFPMYDGAPGVLAQFVQDHPIDEQRIQNLRTLFTEFLQQPSGMPTVR